MNIPPGYVRSVTDEETRRILKENLAKEASFTLTICEQLRFMYDIVEQLPEGDIKAMLTDQLIDAMSMAKKMDSKLSQYRNKYSSDPGSRGKNLIKLYDTRKRKRLREARTI